MSQTLLVLVTILSALVALFVFSVFLVLRRRARLTDWVQGLFRRPPKAGKPPGPGHYYKPYWS